MNEMPPEERKWVVDLAARRVWQSGRELELTPLEYQVLAYLAARAGQVISYSELWQEIWMEESAFRKGERNTVRGVIKRLRRKLQERDGEVLVVRRGVGALLKQHGIEVRGL